LGITILDKQVLALDPTVIAQAVAPYIENWPIFKISQESNSARLPLRPRMPWRSEQRRSSRNELSPPHFDPQWITEALRRIPHSGLGVAGAKLLFSSTGLELTMHQSMQLRADEVLE